MILDSEEKRHIVIVDDEPVNLDIAENALKKAYKLTKLISGEQLLKFLDRVKPDLILLDVYMPKMNGYETLTAIMKNPQTRNIPVIFLTSQIDMDSEKLGFRLGAKDFIKKPFDNEIMLARIHSQIELHVYRTQLEDIIEYKTAQIADLQHILTVSWAEMIESRDGTTGAHVMHTTAYYELLVREIAKLPAYHYDFTEDIIDDLLKASTLHDIGKIGISDAILKKPGVLDAQEMAQMQCHSRIGADLLEKIIVKTSLDSFMNYAREMALLHHERWDGTGYPCKMKGKIIPLFVRVLSIADVYDALTSVRPYKRAFTHTEALKIMTGDSGKFFDPDIFNVFMDKEKEFYNLSKKIKSVSENNEGTK